MKQYWFRITIGFMLMLFLSIIPLPSILIPFRPAWLLLFLLYTQFQLSDYFKIIVIFLVGILMDAILSSVMGEHVFALTAALWCASSKARRFSLLPMGIQMFYIGIFSLIYCLCLLFVNRVLGNPYPVNTLFTVSIVNSIIWPFFRLTADEFYSFRTSKRDWMVF